MNNISLDHEFVSFIRKWEDFRSKAYLDEGGVPTIGFGTISYADGGLVKMGDEITPEQAEHELWEDCKAYYCQLLKGLKVEQNKNQLIALLSLCYNIGPPSFLGSTLLKKLNAGVDDRDEISEQFRRWVYVRFELSRGLVNRREDEIHQYFLTRPGIFDTMPMEAYNNSP